MKGKLTVALSIVQRPVWIVSALLSLLSVTASRGQGRIEGQLGGSNFLAATVNGAYAIPMSYYSPSFFVATTGVGRGISDWSIAPVVHAGCTLEYGRWGAGAEATYFLERLVRNPMFWSFGDMLLIFPNGNCRFGLGKGVYCRVSAGALLAFERGFNRLGREELSYAGDAIPMAGLTLGYSFAQPW